MRGPQWNTAKECPRWHACSCNACPLDPGYEAMEGDEECKATKATKATRIRIVEAAGMDRTCALTSKELAQEARSQAAKERWAALTPEERARRLPPRSLDNLRKRT